MSGVHVAIVGGGFSGTLHAIQLLRHSDARVTLIERAPRLARGVAYSTRHADHLLNVRAAGMTAFPDAPHHFAEWLEARGAGDGKSFAERRLYGTYLEELLADAANGRLVCVTGEVTDIVAGADGETIHLADGHVIHADHVVLSIGNLEPETPRGMTPDVLPASIYVPDPWACELGDGLSDDDVVLLIGTGLTAVDAALMLDTAGFKGRILALSRRGLVPRAHAEPAPVPALDAAPPAHCGALIRHVRSQAESIGWRAAVDQLRPYTQGLWASADPVQRRRFLRHLRPWWDVHRHRIAPSIADRIARMEARGQLVVGAAKIVATEADGDHAFITWRGRGTAAPERSRVARIVNCTGPQGDVGRAPEPLLANLVAAGRIRADVCRIGIDVDADNRVLGRDGAPSTTLSAIGPMTRGAVWEIVAVPDLRGQVERVAQRIAR